MRKHYQIQRASDLDPFLLWAGVLTIAFILFALWIGTNAFVEPPPVVEDEPPPAKKESRIQLHRSSASVMMH